MSFLWPFSIRGIPQGESSRRCGVSAVPAMVLSGRRWGPGRLWPPGFGLCCTKPRSIRKRKLNPACFDTRAESILTEMGPGTSSLAARASSKSEGRGAEAPPSAQRNGRRAEAPAAARPATTEAAPPRRAAPIATRRTAWKIIAAATVAALGLCAKTAACAAPLWASRKTAASAANAWRVGGPDRFMQRLY